MWAPLTLSIFGGGHGFSYTEENEGRAVGNLDGIERTLSSSLGAEPGEGGGVDESQSRAGSDDLRQIGIGGTESTQERP